MGYIVVSIAYYIYNIYSSLPSSARLHEENNEALRHFEVVCVALFPVHPRPVCGYVGNSF